MVYASSNFLYIILFFFGSKIFFCPHSFAQVTSAGSSTRVNGSIFGNCLVGNCHVHGGKKKGDSLFLLLNNLDTRRGVKEVKITTSSSKNVFVSVQSQLGLFLDKPLSLDQKSNLFMIAPGGIWIGNGGKLSNIKNLFLTLATTIAIDGDKFTPFYEGQGISTQLLNSITSPTSDNSRNPFQRIKTYNVNSGNGLTIDGASISVDENLFLNSPASEVILHSSGRNIIKAGSSIQIIGNKISIDGYGLLSGSGAYPASIDIQAISNNRLNSSSSVKVLNATLRARSIAILGESIFSSDSELIAPNGWIRLQSPFSSSYGQSITISESSLTVDQPAILSSYHGSLESPTPLNYEVSASPFISIRSAGSVQIINSKLSASNHSQTDPVNYPNQLSRTESIPVKSGLIEILARGGDLRIMNSSLRSDSSNGFAGTLLFDTSNASELGHIAIKNSYLSASGGLGQGKIFAYSNRGIDIIGSSIHADVSRYPLINGSRFRNWHGASTQQPISFIAGHISLRSYQGPIMINGSKLSATRSARDGPFDIDKFNPYDSMVGNSLFAVRGGKSGATDIYTLGYHYSFSQGNIELYSNGGISISNDSFIDASSLRLPSRDSVESIGGLIQIMNLGADPLVIDKSAILATSPASMDPDDTSHFPGFVTVSNKGGDIIVNNSIIDSSSKAAGMPLDDPTINHTAPIVDLSTDNKLEITSNSIIQASSLVEGNGGIFLYPDFPMSVPLMNPEPVLGFPPDLVPDVFDSIEQIRFSIRDIEINDILNAAPIAIPLVLASPTKNLEYLQRMPTSVAGRQSSAMMASDKSIKSDTDIAFVKAINSFAESASSRLRLAGSRRYLIDIPSLQVVLSRAQTIISSRGLSDLMPRSQPNLNLQNAVYKPAIVQLRQEPLGTDKVRLTVTYLAPTGSAESHSRVVEKAYFDRELASFRNSVTRRDLSSSLYLQSGKALTDILISPITPSLIKSKSNALIIEADRGLQSIPFAALPLLNSSLGWYFALTITPSLGLTDLENNLRNSEPESLRLILAGASRFKGSLEPLPMALQELERLYSEHKSVMLIESEFTSSSLKREVINSKNHQLHLASHARFMSEHESGGILYTSSDQITLSDLGANLRSRSFDKPLDLISISACDTALGNESSELGFMGMALQSGAISGLGTLWEVDDAASAAFFIQFYRYYAAGLPKDLALQATQKAFISGEVKLVGDTLVGPSVNSASASSPLLGGIDSERKLLFAAGLQHPYFWSGMTLTGSPW